MEKVADGYYRYEAIERPSEGVKATLIIDKIDGEDFDTGVILEGGFCIAGSTRKEFFEKLSNLINEYRI